MADDSPPFAARILIHEVAFELDASGTVRGALTRKAFETAPSGASGSVLFGLWRDFRVAVKILPTLRGVAPDLAELDFAAEVDNMVAVRALVDRARTLERAGAPLTEQCYLRIVGRRCREPHDLRGWRHLVYVYGVGTIPDLAALAPGLPPGPAHFVVMEPLTGGSLKTPPRPADVVARAPLELSSGLAALAAAHVVHADLKPENIMLRTPGGELVLTDYGVGRIARGGVDEATARTDGVVNGTYPYWAPELFDDVHVNSYATDM